MAGTVRYVRGLEHRTTRMKLKPGGRTYWRPVTGPHAVGYQRRKAGGAGRWISRTYLGNEKYRQVPLGLADDYEPSDGKTILTFDEAAEIVRKSHATGEDRPASVLTVADAVREYVQWLKTHRATGRETEQRVAKLILPTLGKIRLSDLTAGHINRWRDALAEQPALIRSRPGAEQNYRRAPVSEDDKRARKATTNRLWTVLRAALNRALRAGHVASDAAWRRVETFKQTSASRPGFLTAAEAARLVNASDPEFRLLVRGALETGARFGELATARVRDYQGGKLRIPRSKS
jgi:hypothetical protein